MRVEGLEGGGAWEADWVFCIAGVSWMVSLRMSLLLCSLLGNFFWYTLDMEAGKIAEEL